MTVKIHPTADVSKKARIGDGTSIWHHAHISEGAQIGSECIIGKGVYVGADVEIGNRVKIQNYVSVYEGLTIEDGVMIGPHVCFTNDLLPRAINPDGGLKSSDDWELVTTHIGKGVGLGANATIRCGIKVGKWALVGAGSVVTKDVPDFGLVYGIPAGLRGFVCRHGNRLHKEEVKSGMVIGHSSNCDEKIEIPQELWDKQHD
jgi:acetyltransferase-like isoleucine patch superfamily enzyme